MTTKEYENRLELIWNVMLVVMFGSAIIAKFQEMQIGITFSFFDWVVLILCVGDLLLAGFSIISQMKPIQNDEGKLVTSKVKVIGFVISLVVFAGVLLALSGISVFLTNLMIVLGTLLLLFNAFAMTKTK